MRYLIIVIFIFTNSFKLLAQNVEINITNIRNSKGTILLSFFTNADSFDNDKPSITKKISKETMVDNELKISIKIDLEEFGIALLDDEDNDGKMKYNMIGIPKEGFGFSNYYHTGMSRPDYADFVLKKGTKKNNIKIKYM